LCGRFTLTVHQLGSVVEKLGAAVAEADLARYQPRYNIAPSEAHWLLRAARAPTAGEPRRELLPAFWGLINNWATDPTVAYRQINARSESLLERPAFRDAFKKRRCVVPADGFYEWRGPKSRREPLRFHRSDGGLLLFAGLYDRWQEPEGGLRRTFTIVTTGANALVTPIHDRMPAILAEGDVEEWLHGEPNLALLRPADEGLLLATPASPRVNSPGPDDPGLLDPDDPLVPKQLALF
jgi:putative SOS response-associated peptidase YedK